MPLMDCDPPLAAPGQTATDLIDRLNMMPLNLIRFSRFTFDGDAEAVIPFDDYGAQHKAICLTSTSGIASLLDRDWGAATVGKNGGAYNISFDAYVEGAGTAATLTARWRGQPGGGPLASSSFTDPQINDAADDTDYALTTTPQTFTWQHVASDDPDFFDPVPDNARFDFLSDDLPADTVVWITNIQFQLDDFYAPHPIEFPWRPARGEENLSFYGDYIVSIGRTDMAAKSGERLGIDPVGGNLQPVPNGDRTLPLTAETYTLQRTSDGVKMRTSGAVEIEVPAYADAAIRVHARTGGLILDGSVTLTPGVGVTINDPAGGGLVISGDGVGWSLHKVGEDEWDLAIQGAGGSSSPSPIYMPLAIGTEPPTLVGLGDGRLIPIIWSS